MKGWAGDGWGLGGGLSRTALLRASHACPAPRLGDDAIGLNVERRVRLRSPMSRQTAAGQFLLLQFYNTQELSLLEALYEEMVELLE
jgi:hypothetical protein